MGKNHLKSIATPKTWKISRKKRIFITRPKPGGHPFEHSIALSVAMRGLMKCAKTAKEVKSILYTKNIIVDGKRRRDDKIPVGLMDTVELTESKEYYRLTLNDKGKLITVPIKKEEASLKPCKIIGKTLLKKGKVQLNFSDGRNILVDKDTYKVGDTLLFTLPGQEIKQHLKFEKGMLVFFTKGKHIGKVGEVQEIQDTQLIFKKDKESLQTLKKYAFVIGKDKPVVTLE